MKEVLEILQTVDKQIDDCRYYLTISDNKLIIKELLFDKLQEISKEIKGVLSQMN